MDLEGAYTAPLKEWTLSKVSGKKYEHSTTEVST